MADELWSDDEWRAAMSAADVNDLPDDAFAYIEDGGDKDDEGKTTPRSLRHFPIHDEAHVRNALARAPQSPFGDKAMPKIISAAKKFGVKVGERSKKPRHRSGPSNGVEVRHFAAEGLEVRSGEDGSDSIVLQGTPIVYNTPYAVRDAFGEFQETMLPGVASSLMGKADCRFLINHEGLPLARTTSGTLQLVDTDAGLTFRAELSARSNLANDLADAIGRGDVSQMSCGFIVAKDEWNTRGDERRIHSFADLLDVSAVTYPASPTTSIQVAQRMAMALPVESRARVRKMWQITRDLKDGRSVDAEALDLLSEGLRSLSDADEDRAAPTNVDKKMPAVIAAAHDAVHAALQTQMGDPDNGDDPDDDDVTSHLKNALHHLVAAGIAQGKDGTDDAPEGRSEMPVSGPEADGSSGQPNDDPAVIDDGTGQRASAQLAETRRRKAAAELELARLRK